MLLISVVLLRLSRAVKLPLGDAIDLSRRDTELSSAECWKMPANQKHLDE